MTEIIPGPIENPPEIEHGFVTGRFVEAIADTLADSDRYPDLRPLSGSIEFRPRQVVHLYGGLHPATVVKKPVVVDVDDQGYLVDASSSFNSSEQPGVYLAVGQYEVRPSSSMGIPSFIITVTAENTKENPVDLTLAAPVVPPPGTIEVVTDETRLRAEQAAAEAEASADQAEQSANAAQQTAESISDIDEQVGEIRGYFEDAETAASNAADSANTAQQAVSGIEDQITRARNQADRSESQADRAQNLVNSVSGIEDQVELAEGYVNEAAISASDAEAAATAAADSASLADTHRSNAVNARNEARTARDDAQTARDEAQTHRTKTLEFRNTAQNAAQNARDARDTAQAAATAAANDVAGASEKLLHDSGGEHFYRRNFASNYRGPALYKTKRMRVSDAYPAGWRNGLSGTVEFMREGLFTFFRLHVVKDATTPLERYTLDTGVHLVGDPAGILFDMPSSVSNIFSSHGMIVGRYGGSSILSSRVCHVAVLQDSVIAFAPDMLEREWTVLRASGVFVPEEIESADGATSVPSDNILQSFVA